MPPPRAPRARRFTLLRDPFSRSYGVNLPSSLTRVHSTPEATRLTHLCRFRVRLPHALARGFSWQPGIIHLVTIRSRHHLSECLAEGICLLSPPTGLHRHFQSPAGLPVCVPPSLKRAQGRTGILTRWPSPTPCGLGLGTDSPWAEYLAQEPLGLRRGGFTPPLSLLMPTCALPSGPRRVTVALHPPGNAPLPCRLRGIRRVGTPLESREFSAPYHSTSELLRFL